MNSKLSQKLRLRECCLPKEAFNGFCLKGRDACAWTVVDLGLERSVSISALLLDFLAAYRIYMNNKFNVYYMQ